MSNLTEIRVKETNPCLVEHCEKLLADAKEGKLVGILGVVIFHDGIASPHWINPDRQVDTNIVCDRVIGCFERIKFELLAGRMGLGPEDSWRGKGA